MNKNVILIGLAVVVLGTGYFMTSGMSDGGADSDGKSEAASSAKPEADPAAADKAPKKVTKDEEKAEEPKEARRDLALPRNLPRLNVKEQAAKNAEPVKPHGELKLDGDLKELDAKEAIKAIFPKIRSCYVELRQRAPQAKGRMLMRFRVSNGSDGNGGTGELFLKETQFTDPKYLTCVRDAIDNTKVKLSGPTVNGTVTFPLHLTPEDVDRHNATSK